jgi:hypothetical protein
MRQLTVKIENRPLHEKMVTRARAIQNAGRTVPLPQALIAGGGVVTATPIQPGQPITEGQPVIEVNGRPVFAFTWPFRAYRELRQGMEGPDVAELDASLVEMGLLAQANDSFDVATSIALRRHYQTLGYSLDGMTAAAPGADGGAGQTANRAGEVSLGPDQVVNLASDITELASLNLHVGTEITSETTELGSATAGTIEVVAALPAPQAQTLKAGDAAVLTQGATDVALEVASVAKEVTEIPGIGTGVRVTLNFKGTAGRITPDGQTEKLAIAGGGSADAVRAVPVTAIYANPDGSSYVELPESQGSTRIPVTIGESAGGWVQLRDPDPRLTEKAELVIGKQ